MTFNPRADLGAELEYRRIRLARDAETKHDPKNGQFTSGGGGSGAGENIGAGMGEMHDRQKDAEKKYPKGSKVKNAQGETLTVTGHQGMMIHTVDKDGYQVGPFHEGKLSKA
jgi:hypothetical protein